MIWHDSVFCGCCGFYKGKSGHPTSILGENICSKDDLRSRIFGTFVVKFLACLPPRIFEHLKNGIIAHF